MALTKDQWYAHPSFRDELAKLLSHPTFQTALAMAEKSGLKPTPINTGVDLVHFFALMGAKRDGYFEALANLVALSKPQVTAPVEPSAWTNTASAADSDRTSAP